jgi:ppGpp synthetase/RelA/SpoT-type nucleotidyltranferase
MKIPPSFNQAYMDVRPVLERLEAVVKPRAEEIAKRYNGVYTGRIKEPESILIKSLKEGYDLLFLNMYVLFACTITVPNPQAIEDVRRDVEATFQLVEVRQRAVKPEEFAYNDLNLSLKVIPEFWNRGEAYLDLVFELQIKTLLQQAWSQAGHDVIYKAGKKTWGLTRITSQLRALLEMADSLLANLDSAASILQGTIEYPKYSKRNQIIDILEGAWDDPRLPGNLDRAALVIENYLGLAGLASGDLVELLRREEYRRYVEARSLTPTQAVFIILFQEKWGDMKPRLKKRKVLITSEMLDLCPNLAKIPRDYRINF